MFLTLVGLSPTSSSPPLPSAALLHSLCLLCLCSASATLPSTPLCSPILLLHLPSLQLARQSRIRRLTADHSIAGGTPLLIFGPRRLLRRAQQHWGFRRRRLVLCRRRLLNTTSSTQTIQPTRLPPLHTPWTLPPSLAPSRTVATSRSTMPSARSSRRAPSPRSTLPFTPWRTIPK